MDTKLTIRIKSNVVERAKEYARNHNITVTKMVESYLDSVSKQAKNDIEITPLVQSLSGVAKINDNKDYSDYLSEKYK